MAISPKNVDDIYKVKNYKTVKEIIAYIDKKITKQIENNYDKQDSFSVQLDIPKDSYKDYIKDIVQAYENEKWFVKIQRQTFINTPEGFIGYYLTLYKEKPKKLELDGPFKSKK